MEWLQDIAVLFVVGVLLYALLGDALAKLGLKPLLLASLQVALEVAHMLVGWIQIAVTWFGYRVLLGRKEWRARGRYVETDDEDAPEVRPLPVSQPSQRTAQLPIATPQTARNAPVVIAPLVNDLTADELLIAGVLARLIASGELTQTAAIKTGLGIAPGSRSPRYQVARAAIQAELLKLAPPTLPPADDPEAWERNGRDGLTRIRTAAR